MPDRAESSIAFNDSGLTCPWCGHNLTALRSKCCPECGRRFVLARPGAAQHDGAAMSIASNSMVCPDCGHGNYAFMPRACRMCGRRFSMLQRIFGISRRGG